MSVPAEPFRAHVSFPPLISATLRRRLNRFCLEVEVDGKAVKAHLPNSGRLQEVLHPGNAIWIARRDGAARRTQYDAVLAASGDTLVSIDARLPNDLVHTALVAGTLAEFSEYTVVQREVGLNNSRIDFSLEGIDRRCLLEVKSVTLITNGRGLFPDAPTVRGCRHLQELSMALDEGIAAAVMFVIQRPDADAFAPNDDADPVFGETLRCAYAKGVRVLAYRCAVDLAGIELQSPVPVLL